jgi:glucose-6-phosphate isomerase
MIDFNFDNCMAENIGDEHGIAQDEWTNHETEFSKAHETLCVWRESKDAIFFDMPARKEMVRPFVEKANQVRSNFDNVVVLGIGGSALGLSCLAKATLKPFYNLLSRDERGGPRLFVCDNIDPESFGELLATLDPTKTFINVISKSGGTTETMSQFAIALKWIKDAVGDGWKKHVTATTDPESGKLRSYVTDTGIDAFEVPQKLGGRYSVLSAVGLLPAACLGIDIERVLSGAESMATQCETSTSKDNPGYQIGALNFLLSKLKGKNVTVMMPYSDRLSLFGDWYAQLWAESLGKEGKGQTVVKSLGVTDQHSQLQLFMEGPNDKVISFVGASSFDNQGRAIEEPFPSFEYLKGKRLGEILHAEQRATAQALAKVSHPNMTVTVDRVMPESIGELFFVYEVACAYCGALMGINPFNQPGVELGKKLTKEILGA